MELRRVCMLLFVLVVVAIFAAISDSERSAALFSWLDEEAEQRTPETPETAPGATPDSTPTIMQALVTVGLGSMQPSRHPVTQDPTSRPSRSPLSSRSPTTLQPSRSPVSAKESMRATGRKFEELRKRNVSFYVNDVASLTPVLDKNKKLLGEFDKSKGYSYIPLSCSIMHQVSPGFNYTCEDGNPYSKPYFKVIPGKPPMYDCGGLLMFAGNCINPAEGKFLFSKTIAPDNSTKKWCGTKRNDYSYATYDEPTGSYKPRTCDLDIIEPKRAVKKLGGKLVVIMGDSHVRQLFYAFVAEFRNQRIVVESHPDEHVKWEYRVFTRYEVSEEGDDFRDGFYADFIDPKPFRKCLTTSSGECTIFLYVWLVTFETQTHFVLEHLPKLAPHSVIVSLAAAWDGTADLPAFWTKAWENYKPFLEKWVFLTFPKRYQDAVRAKQMQNWVETNSLNETGKMFVLHRECFHQNLFTFSEELQCSLNEKNIGVDVYVNSNKWKDIAAYRAPNQSLQYQFNAHSVCIIYDNWHTPGSVQALYKLASLAECEGWIDRALARTAFSFLLHP